MMKKLLACVVAALVASAGLLSAAPAPSSVWGEVPGGLRAQARTAVLVASDGREIARGTVGPDGRFTFPSVAPGQYVVKVLDDSGKEIAHSASVRVEAERSVQALFEEGRRGGAVLPVAGGGIGKTGVIIIGAGVAGIATAIVIATHNDNGPASPSR
jgi:hypothetical protein